MPPASMYARLRGCQLAIFALAVGACDSVDPTEPVSTADVVTSPAAAPLAPSFASSFRGGIPLGAFGQPTSAFGAQYNGALRIIYPKPLLQELADIKARGGKVVLNLAGGESRYKDKDGHFSMSLWKASVDRYKGLNLTPYIKDGTIISHYLMDEPHNSKRWHGKPVSPATVEEMARYSKQLWPDLPTVVRAYPDYLAGLSGKYRYLDAAWLQYVHRFGEVEAFTRRQVSHAQDKGLGVIAGLNILKGSPDKRELTGSQIESWGATLVNNTHVCAMINWTYNSRYLERREIKEAMAKLANQAENRASKTCRGINGQTTGAAPDLSGSEPPPPPPVTPEPPPPPAPPAPPEPPAHSPAPAPIQLSVGDVTEKSGRHFVLLTWAGAAGSQVDLYRNGGLRRTAKNTGRTNIIVDPNSRTAYDVQICEAGTSRCSNTEILSFR